MDNNFTRLRKLFDQCIDLPDAEREQWIEQNVDAWDLRIELELMLAADRGQPGILDVDIAEHILSVEGPEEAEYDS